MAVPSETKQKNIYSLSIKKLPAKVGDMGSILDWEDPLEKGIATHSNILAWEIPWTEEPGEL